MGRSTALAQDFVWLRGMGTAGALGLYAESGVSRSERGPLEHSKLSANSAGRCEFGRFPL